MFLLLFQHYWLGLIRHLNAIWKFGSPCIFATSKGLSFHLPSFSSYILQVDFLFQGPNSGVCSGRYRQQQFWGWHFSGRNLGMLFIWKHFRKPALLSVLGAPPRSIFLNLPLYLLISAKIFFGLVLEASNQANSDHVLSKHKYLKYLWPY